MSAKYSAQNNSIPSQREAQIVVNSFEDATSVLENFGLIPTDDLYASHHGLTKEEVRTKLADLHF